MKKIIFFIFFFLVISCSTTDEIYDDLTAPDYVSSSRSRNLEIPPDLSEIESNDSYSVPGEVKSYQDYIEREKSLNSELNNVNIKKVIENPDGIKIVKSGTLRWMTVDKKPEILWPHIKDFWEEMGFRITVANKRTGIIETQWTDTNDIKLESNSGAISRFDKWLDSLSGFADKRKFRTRIELTEDGKTEIYISQRSVDAALDQHSKILETRNSEYNVSTIYKIQEYIPDGEDGEKIEISESRKLDDYEIDSELLTRLMIKLGAADFDAREKVANPLILVKAKLINDKSDTYLKMLDPYDRSWRRLGLALDIIGFVTEDKNRSEGIFYVRFSQIDLPSKKDEEDNEGIIDKLIFWDDDETKKPKAEETESLDAPINVPEVKPIDEEYDSNSLTKKTQDEETWVSKIWPTWGGEAEEKTLPNNEKRFRIRIKANDEKSSVVFLDFPSGKKNNSNDAKKVLNILYEHLK